MVDIYKGDKSALQQICDCGDLSNLFFKEFSTVDVTFYGTGYGTEI